MFVYRKSYQHWDASGLLGELSRRADAYEERPNDETSGALLLRAAELETALEDAGAASALPAAELTNRAARLLLGSERCSARELKRCLLELALPERLTLRRPEGYAYYALDPLRYAELAREASLRKAKATVIGVRSIGTSLSAVVCAALRERGIDVRRATVRPHGHPYDRAVTPQRHALEAIRAGIGGEFVIVDEGPGLSGSSFLAAADMLVAQGVPRDDLVVLCSHQPDVSRLLAPNAAARWAELRVSSARGTRCPSGALDISAGQWRKITHGDEASYPPSWPQCERVKFLFTERDELQRFIGFPPYGERAQECATLLGEAGFSPLVLGRERGFLRQRWQRGRYFSRSPRALPLARIAEYIAFRCRNLTLSNADSGELDEMMRHNVREALGAEVPSSIQLRVERPAYVDGRLAPHEWLLTPDGHIVKTDSSDHGDDHLYPGPCDIAWDLAGAVVEWDLDNEERDALLSCYRAESADDARRRINPYILAYSAFRLGSIRMALLSAPQSEHSRLLPLEQLYLQRISQTLASC